MMSRERIKSLIGETFGVDPMAVPDDAAAGEYEGWDSLHHLELMLALELEFGVTLSAETMLELTSIEAIEQYLLEGEPLTPDREMKLQPGA